MRSVLGNRILFVFSLMGAGVSAYLTLAHFQLVSLACTALRGCEDVQQSTWAQGFGIPFLSGLPTAAFGLLMYLALVALSFVRVVTDSERVARAAQSAQWAMSLVGVLLSLWLTYLEAYTIHAWCQWCVASAIIIFLVFITATAERFGPTPSIQGEAT